MSEVSEQPKSLAESLRGLSPNLPFTDIHGIPSDGYVERLENGRVLVVTKGEVYATNFPGVQCLNPDHAHDEGKVFYKIFEKNRVFTPDEYEEAVRQLKPEPNVVIISMNGFSRIKPDDLVLWGIDEGEYEHACLELFNSIVKSVRGRFRGVNVKLIDGGSDIGIDKVLRQSKRDNGLESLSFSCPNWSLYVPDDGRNLFIAQSSDEYAERYIQSVDCLIATGGREQAFKHDIYAAIKYGKYITFVNVLGALVRNGGVPAVQKMPDGTNKIQNAAAAMEQFIAVVRGQDHVSFQGQGERWKSLVFEACNRMNEACFKVLPPEVKFKARF